MVSVSRVSVSFDNSDLYPNNLAIIGFNATVLIEMIAKNII